MGMLCPSDKADISVDTVHTHLAGKGQMRLSRTSGMKTFMNRSGNHAATSTG